MKKILINKLKSNSLKNQVNYNSFITMDIETMIKNNYQIIVAISVAYYNKDESIKNKVVLINPTLLNINEEIAIKDLWSRLFDILVSYQYETNPSKVEKNKNLIIFMHNLGKFDGIYLIKGLLTLVHYSKVKTIINKENEFIEINAKINNINLIWKDSLRIFNVSLHELGTIFNTKNKKLHEYKSEYNHLNLLNNLILKKEFIQYSAQDSIVLLEALKIAQNIYFNLYNIDITNIWSASTLAMTIFRLKYLKKSIPTLNKYLDRFIRESYFGGITDVYKLYGENIYYYDVNSLYPEAMLNPMPSNLIKYHHNMNKVLFSEFFGFCTAKIITPDNLEMPLLPLRLKNGTIIYPKGQWTGTYFSEELKTVMSYGYKIKPLYGYSFEKEYYFNDYVNYFYNLKKNANGPLRFIIKNLLNNLYGYFGRSLDFIKTINVNSKEMIEISTHKLIHNIIPIDEKKDIYAISISGETKQNTLKSLNLNLITSTSDQNKILNNNQNLLNLTVDNLNHNKNNNPIPSNLNWQPKLNIKLNEFNPIKANVAIASAVTAYARIKMIQLKMTLMQMGYQIFYSDTDSLFINKPLPSSYVNNDLGGLKDELKGVVIYKAYFLGTKKYGYQIKLDNGSLIDKSVFAGITRDSIPFNDIEKLAKGEVLHTTKLIQFNRDLDQFKIQIKQNIPVQLKKSQKKNILNNNYVTPSTEEYTHNNQIK